MLQASKKIAKHPRRLKRKLDIRQFVPNRGVGSGEVLVDKDPALGLAGQKYKHLPPYLQKSSLRVFRLLRKHLTGSVPSVCGTCLSRYKNPKSLDIHINAIHNGLTPEGTTYGYFRCEHCPKAYFGRDSLLRHITKKHLELLEVDTAEIGAASSLSCGDCDRYFESGESFEQHVFEFHDGAIPRPQKLENTFSCGGCSGKFQNLIQLLEHVNETHGGVFPLVTQVSGLPASRPEQSPGELEKKQVEELQESELPFDFEYRRFVCGGCPQRFLQLLDFLEHTKANHDGIPPPKSFIIRPLFDPQIPTPFVCGGSCGKEFCNVIELRNHISINHRERMLRGTFVRKGKLRLKILRQGPSPPSAELSLLSLRDQMAELAHDEQLIVRKSEAFLPAPTDVLRTTQRFFRSTEEDYVTVLLATATKRLKFKGAFPDARTFKDLKPIQSIQPTEREMDLDFFAWMLLWICRNFLPISFAPLIFWLGGKMWTLFDRFELSLVNINNPLIWEEVLSCCSSSFQDSFNEELTKHPELGMVLIQSLCRIIFNAMRAILGLPPSRKQETTSKSEVKTEESVDFKIKKEEEEEEEEEETGSSKPVGVVVRKI